METNSCIQWQISTFIVSFLCLCESCIVCYPCTRRRCATHLKNYEAVNTGETYIPMTVRSCNTCDTLKSTGSPDETRKKTSDMTTLNIINIMPTSISQHDTRLNDGSLSKPNIVDGQTNEDTAPKHMDTANYPTEEDNETMFATQVSSYGKERTDSVTENEITNCLRPVQENENEDLEGGKIVFGESNINRDDLNGVYENEDLEEEQIARGKSKINRGDLNVVYES